LKTFVSAVVAIASWIIIRLIGIDFAEFWAVLIFIFNFIPYVGSFVAVLLPVLLTLVQFGAPGPFLVALVGLTGVQMVVGNFVEPRLMGNSLNLSPIVILLSLAAWSALWGVVGAFLCVPITVVMLIVFSEFEATRPLAILLSQDGRIRPEESKTL
jgi:AI-2 transport protein TqsA